MWLVWWKSSIDSTCVLVTNFKLLIWAVRPPWCYVYFYLTSHIPQALRINLNFSMGSFGQCLYSTHCISSCSNVPESCSGYTVWYTMIYIRCTLNSYANTFVTGKFPQGWIPFFTKAATVGKFVARERKTHHPGRGRWSRFDQNWPSRVPEKPSFS